jgi:hypothetical protein
MTVFDVGAIIYATMPLLYVAFLSVTIPENEPPSDRFIAQLFVMFGAACLIWLVSGIYIFIGCLRGRKMAFLGMLVTIVSLACILACLQ